MGKGFGSDGDKKKSSWSVEDIPITDELINAVHELIKCLCTYITELLDALFQPGKVNKINLSFFVLDIIAARVSQSSQSVGCLPCNSTVPLLNGVESATYDYLVSNPWLQHLTFLSMLHQVCEQINIYMQAKPVDTDEFHRTIRESIIPLALIVLYELIHRFTIFLEIEGADISLTWLEKKSSQIPYLKLGSETNDVIMSHLHLLFIFCPKSVADDVITFADEPPTGDFKNAITKKIRTKYHSRLASMCASEGISYNMIYGFILESLRYFSFDILLMLVLQEPSKSINFTQEFMRQCVNQHMKHFQDYVGAKQSQINKFVLSALQVCTKYVKQS